MNTEINYIKLAIEKTVNNWDFSKGRITQKSVTESLGMGIKSVQKEWCHVKDIAKQKNDSFRISSLLKSNHKIQ